MADQSANQSTPAAETPAEQAPATRATRRLSSHPLRGRGDLWQIPTLLLGFALIAIGLFAWIKTAKGPDFDAAFHSIEQLNQTGEYDAALEFLNGTVLSHLDDPAATSDVWLRFHLLRADALYLSQRAQEISLPENHNRVIAEYQSAMEIDPSALDGRRMFFYADTLLSLGRVADAESYIQRIPANESDRRIALIKRIVLDALSRPVPQYDKAEQWLAALKQEPRLTASDRIWAVGRQNEIRLALGRADRVVDDLLLEIQRVDDPLSIDAAELFLILGKAYMELGELETAQAQLARAESILSDGAASQGRVQIALAQIAQMRGDIEESRDRFAQVADQYRTVDLLAQSYLGLGETEATLGRAPESLEAYKNLIALFDRSDAANIQSVTRAQIDASIAQRHRERFAAGELRLALEYATLAETIFAKEQLPADSVLRTAETYRALAGQLGAVNLDDPDSAPDLNLVDAVTLEEVRVNFFRAGEYFHRHARMVIVGDAQRAADSQWLAADSFDRAGDREEAIRHFNEFVHTQPKDPRQIEAKYRLARGYQAIGDLVTAIALYSEVLNSNPTSSPAAKSYVPLARAYIQRQTPEDIARAEELLLELLTGTMFEPEAIQFREALAELGKLYRRTDRYTQAIERLTEYLERYEDSGENLVLEFNLADSYRLSAAEIDEQLATAMPQAERAALLQLREERLLKALDLYEAVRAQIEANDPRRIREVEGMMLRNAMFYRGDCAFDLGQFELAIKYYDAAAQRYSQEPSALVAMVQIVNAYTALGKQREARTAHERARARLAEMPPEVWDSGLVPMDRKYWERWLDASVSLQESQASAEEAG